MSTRGRAAKVALAATLGVGVALLARKPLGAPWLGFVAIGLLFVAIGAGEVATVGTRKAVVVGVVIAVVVLLAFVVELTSG